MDIIWNVNTVLDGTGGSEVVEVSPNDVWRGIKLSQPILNHLRGVQTTDITRNNEIFANIPTDWYVVEN